MIWNGIDVAIVAIVLLSMLTGLFRGFIKELIALCVWIAAFWLAFNYSSYLDPWLSSWIHDKSLRTICEFIIILFAILILGGIINAIIGSILRLSGLGGTDRLLGMVFGFARGVFIVAFLMLGAKMAGWEESYQHDSKLYGYFVPLVDWLSGYVPDFIKQVQYFDKNQIPSVPQRAE